MVTLSLYLAAEKFARDAANDPANADFVKAVMTSPLTTEKVAKAIVGMTILNEQTGIPLDCPFASAVAARLLD